MATPVLPYAKKAKAAVTYGLLGLLSLSVVFGDVAPGDVADPDASQQRAAAKPASQGKHHPQASDMHSELIFMKGSTGDLREPGDSATSAGLTWMQAQQVRLISDDRNLASRAARCTCVYPNG